MLSLADRLDSIAGFFMVGLVPSGSEDPFALRRHATAIVRILIESRLRLNLCASGAGRARRVDRSERDGRASYWQRRSAGRHRLFI